jgi:hypothetical protein
MPRMVRAFTRAYRDIQVMIDDCAPNQSSRRRESVMTRTKHVYSRAAIGDQYSPRLLEHLASASQCFLLVQGIDSDGLRGDARAGSVKRAGRAIGEGAAIVALIHQHLAARNR